MRTACEPALGSRAPRGAVRLVEPCAPGTCTLGSRAPGEPWAPGMLGAPRSHGPRGCWVRVLFLAPLLSLVWDLSSVFDTLPDPPQGRTSWASLGSGPPTVPPSPAPPPLKPHLQGAEGQAAGLQRGDALGQVVGLLGLPLLLLLVPALLGLGQHQALQGQGPLSPPGPPRGRRTPGRAAPASAGSAAWASRSTGPRQGACEQRGRPVRAVAVAAGGPGEGTRGGHAHSQASGLASPSQPPLSLSVCVGPQSPKRDTHIKLSRSVCPWPGLPSCFRPLPPPTDPGSG